ncbi:MAG: hypothetical protein RR244_02685, partial [Oscillospiraceae bacterium]
YSQSLLRFGTAKGMIHATPLAFGEGDTKSRVKNVLSYKKTEFWIVAAAIVAVVALAVVLVSNPAPKRAQKEIASATQVFLAQDSSYTVVEQSYVYGDAVLLLAAAPNPMLPEENMGYGVFVMEKADGAYSLAASAECDPSMSLGFSASLLKWNGLTVVFGDLGKRYWNFRTDEVIPAEYTSVRVLYEGGEQSVSVTSNAPYLVVIEGDVQVSDIEYYAGDTLVTGYASNYNGSNSSILPRGLTKDEIAQVNEAFETLLPDGDGDAAAITGPDGEFALNPISHFFTSYYEIPPQMDIGRFVYYIPRETFLSSADETEIASLKEAYAQQPIDGFLATVPFGRIPFATVEQYLQKYMNVSLADMTNMGDALYLEEYKTFYSYASDFGPGVFECTAGETNGVLVTLYSEHAVLTLRKEGESYFIFSHVAID